MQDSIESKVLQELEREGRKADRIDKDRAEKLQALAAHPSWPTYVELLNALIQDCADRMMAPALGLDGCIGQEYVKGTMSGLMRARDMPSAIVQAMAQVRTPDDDAEDAK